MLLPHNFEGYVTSFAPHEALKLIASGNLTFDEGVELYRVACLKSGTASLSGNPCTPVSSVCTVRYTLYFTFYI